MLLQFNDTIAYLFSINGRLTAVGLRTAVPVAVV